MNCLVYQADTIFIRSFVDLVCDRGSELRHIYERVMSQMQ